MIQITKSEYKSINAYENDLFKMDELIFTRYSKGKEMRYLIILSNGRKKLQSGYPFIKIIGKGMDGKFYDLGYYDHYVTLIPTNNDSLGKNIIRIAPWDHRCFIVSWEFDPGSSFHIGDRQGEAILR